MLCYNTTIHLTFRASLRALYALDPVGTNGTQTPPKLLGFPSNRLARAVKHARVILMFGERRVPFQPNIYRDCDDDADLKQVRLINVAVSKDF